MWLAKLRPEQPSAFSVAVVLTLAGVPGFQASAFAMLKVVDADRAHNLAWCLDIPMTAHACKHCMHWLTISMPALPRWTEGDGDACIKSYRTFCFRAAA